MASTSLVAVNIVVQSNELPNLLLPQILFLKERILLGYLVTTNAAKVYVVYNYCGEFDCLIISSPVDKN